MTDQVEILYQFEKPGAVVQAYLTRFHGREYAHIREWIEPRDQPGAPLIPTRAGIAVEVGDLDELERAVAALRRAVLKPERSDPHDLSQTSARQRTDDHPPERDHRRHPARRA